VIEGNDAETRVPRMNVDFTLTTGVIRIGPVNSKLLISEGVTFTNHGTVNAHGDLLNDGTTTNWGVYNGGVITTKPESKSPTLGGLPTMWLAC